MIEPSAWSRLCQGSVSWGQISARPYRGGAPADEFVSNAHAVCLVNGLVVLVRGDASGLDLPGGTREPDESIDATLARELMEEVGASILSSEIVFWWDCVSSAPSAFRPHIPHPRFYIAVYSCEASLSFPPSWLTAPESNEEGMTELVLVSPRMAVDMLREEGKELLADIVEAHFLGSGSLTGTGPSQLPCI